jgi:hypothetical protein
MRPKSKPRAVPPPVEPKPEHPALAKLKQSRWLYALVSLLLLLPCYWQPRIEAGDLSSHIYNAWLAQLVESGRLQGLALIHLNTNVLFDLMLGGMLPVLGPDAAQRVAVSLAVLVFIWGAFAFARVVSGRKPWLVLPCIAMLAYGWVYHMGFFNFYLSMGLCFWAMALLWEPTRWRVAAAVPILALAYLAHALPIAWALGLAAYVILARRVSDKQRMYLTAGAVAAMVLARLAISGMMQAVWVPDQFTLISGTDHMWVFDQKYFAVLVGLLFIWVVWFLGLTRRDGARAVMFSIPFQLCVLSAAAVLFLPTAVSLPSYRHALVFIAQRMSLGVGISVCALLACANPSRFRRVPVTAIAILFFGFLFHDEHAINAFEARLQDTAAGVPQGQRVLSAIDAPNLRVNPLVHLVDRVCIGHCYSYANYEPSTWQFRVRATADNPYVTSSYQDSWEMQMGMYVVKDRDLPLYQVDMGPGGQMVVRTLRAGVPCGSTQWNVLGDLL